MGMEEALDSPGFWILGGGGLIAELGGYILARNSGWVVMPLWQLIIMMIGTLIAAAFFATKE